MMPVDGSRPRTDGAAAHVAVVIPVGASAVVLDKMRADYSTARLGMESRFAFIDADLPSIESPEDVRAAEEAVVRGVATVAAEGADSAIVACFSEPGVQAAARAVDIPVIGEGRVTVAAVGAIFERFSILSASSSTFDAKAQMVAELGLEARLKSLVSLDVPVAELTVARAGDVARLVAAEVDDGADAVVLGCTGLEPGFTEAVRRALSGHVSRTVVVDPADVAGRVAVALAIGTRGVS